MIYQNLLNILTIQFYIGKQAFLLKMVRLEDWIAGESGMSYRSRPVAAFGIKK